MGSMVLSQQPRVTWHCLCFVMVIDNDSEVWWAVRVCPSDSRADWGGGCRLGPPRIGMCMAPVHYSPTNPHVRLERP